MPDDKKLKLFEALSGKGLYTKSYADFQQQFADDAAVARLHQKLTDEQLYTKDLASFRDQFFVEEKKNSDSLVSSGPSAWPGTELAPTAGTDWTNPVPTKEIPAKETTPQYSWSPNGLVQGIVTPSQVGPVGEPKTTQAHTELAKEVEEDVALQRIRQKRNGDYVSTGDQIAIQNAENADYLKVSLGNRTPMEQMLFKSEGQPADQGTVKQYEYELGAIQIDMNDAQGAISSLDRQIKREFGDDVFQKHEALVTQTSGLAQKLEAMSKDEKLQSNPDLLREYNSLSFQYAQNLDQLKQWEENPLWIERNGLSTSVQKNYEKAVNLLKEDRFRLVREMYDIRQSAQKYENKQSDELRRVEKADYFADGVILKSVGRLAAGLGTLMDMGENLTVGEGEYGTWDMVEDYLKGLSEDAQTTFPTPSKWSRPLITNTTDYTVGGKKYQVDIDGSGNITSVRDKNGQAIDVPLSDAQRAEILNQPRREQWNPDGLVYKSSEVMTDLLFQIGATKAIGSALPNILPESAKAVIAVTATTAGMMSQQLFDEGMQVFDGDKKKASQYALLTGTLIGVGANMFGMESRLAGMDYGGFAGQVFKKSAALEARAAVGKMTFKDAAILRAKEMLKEGLGEAYEETIQETAIGNVTKYMFGAPPQKQSKADLIETALVSFIVGAVGGGMGHSDIRDSSILAAGKNPDAFEAELKRQIDNGTIKIPVAPGEKFEEVRDKYIEDQRNKVLKINRVVEAIGVDDKVAAVPVVEALIDAQQEKAKAEATKIEPLVKQAEVKVKEAEAEVAKVIENDKPIEHTQEQEEPTPIGDIVGKRVIVNGYAGRLSVNDEGAYVVDDGQREYEIPDVNKDASFDFNTLGARVLPDRTVTYNSDEDIQLTGIKDPVRFVEEVTDETGRTIGVKVESPNGRIRTITDPQIVNDITESRNKISNQIDVSSPDQVSQKTDETIQAVAQHDNVPVDDVQQISDSLQDMPESVDRFLSVDAENDGFQQAIDNNELSEDDLLEVDLWAGDKITELEKLPDSDYKQSVIENLKALQNASKKIRGIVPPVEVQQEQEQSPREEKDPINKFSHEADRLEDEHPAQDDAIENAELRSKIEGPAKEKAKIVTDPVSATQTATTDVIQQIGEDRLSGEFTDEQLIELLNKVNFSEFHPGFFVEMFNGKLTIDGTFGTIELTSEQLVTVLRKSGVRAPSKVNRNKLTEISKRLLPENAQDDIAVGFAEGIRISRADYERYGDPNYLRDNRAMHIHFLSKKNTTSIDVWAQELSERWGIDEQAAIEQIIEFINQGGTGDYLRGRIEEQERGFAQHPMFEDVDTTDVSEDDLQEVFEDTNRRVDAVMEGWSEKDINDFNEWVDQFTDEEGNTDWEGLQRDLQDKDFATSFLNINEKVYDALTSQIEAIETAGENQAQADTETTQAPTESVVPAKPLRLQAVEEQLERAKEELSAARTAMKAKAKELDKGLMADSEDLFGERAYPSDQMLFDERADASQRSVVLAPYLARIDAAEAEVKRLMQLQEEARMDEDQTLFGSTPVITKNGFAIPLVGDKINNFIDRFIKKTFTSKGLLNQKVFDLNMDRVGAINAQMQKAAFTVRKMKKIIKEIHGNPSKEVLEDLDAALKNPALMAGGIVNYRNGAPIEAPLRAVLRDMRGQVNGMSAELVALGIAEGDLAIKILDNMDTYVTRSYRVHDDKSWVDKVEKLPVWNRAVNWFKAMTNDEIQDLNDARDEYQDRRDDAQARILKSSPGTKTRAKALSAYRFWNQKMAEMDEHIARAQDRYDNAEANVRAMLEEQSESLSMGGVAKKGKLGSKDFGVFKKRKDIPQEIRELFGEYEDPMVNYAKSIFKQIHLIENAKFLRRVQEAGLGKFLFIDPKEGFTTKIAAETSKTMSPLNGLYTSQELAEAFNTFNEVDQAPAWLAPFVMLSSVAKYGKTILSPVTHLRNFISNAFFHIGNGRVSFRNFKEAWQLAKTDVDLLEKYLGGSPDAEEKVQHLIELGVLHDSVTFKEMKAMMEDAKDGWEAIWNNEATSRAKRMLNEAQEAVQQLYQAEDDFHKVMAFAGEKARYARALYGVSFDRLTQAQKEEVERKAAGIVRNTMPTYSLIPENVQKLRRIPFVGTFPSFPYEVLRTTKNTLTQAAEDMKDHRTRKIGIARVIGLTAVSSGLVMLSKLMRGFVGMDDEDEDGMRWFLPPWSENSIILPVKKNGPDISYIDITNVVPQGFMLSVFNTMFDKRKDGTDRAGEMISALMMPFLSRDMVFQRISEAFYNEKQNGSVIAAKDDPSNIRKRIFYASDVFIPGGVDTGRRIIKSLTNPELDYYGSLSPKTEITTALTGIRISPMNVEGSFFFRARDMADRAREDKQIYYKERNKQIYNGMPEDEKAEKLAPAKERARKAWNVMYTEALKVYSDAVKLGADPEKLQDHLRKAGFNAKEIENIAAGMMMEARFDDDPKVRERKKRRKR